MNIINNNNNNNNNNNININALLEPLATLQEIQMLHRIDNKGQMMYNVSMNQLDNKRCRTKSSTTTATT